MSSIHFSCRRTAATNRYNLDMTRDLIFTQKRVGLNGRLFTIYKFRTMYPGADEDKSKYLHLNETDGPVFKILDDPRFTKIGKWLAKTGLDELPQFVNVVKGEMTLVGPRPLPINEEAKIPDQWRWKRRTVKPGITSSWVVAGGHNLRFREWMKLDMKDIKRKSFFYDFVILVKTLGIVARNAAHFIYSAAVGVAVF